MQQFRRYKRLNFKQLYLDNGTKLKLIFAISNYFDYDKASISM